jgi:tRNA(His) 5'-end guanylyltransferase
MTRGFQKPCDVTCKLKISYIFLKVHKAMLACTKDLVGEYKCSVAYTESDEISLVFPAPESPAIPLMYAGKITKITSLSAGFCTARFNYHLSQMVSDTIDEKVH